MKKTIALSVGLFSILLMAIVPACTPSAPDYIEDYDVVYTNEKKGYDFSTVNTYFLPDTVVFSDPGGSGGDHKYDATILASLKSNLDALGWTQLSESGPESADVVVLPSGSTQQYASCAAYCWYCYWGWYPGWGYYPPAWGPGYGWGYPSSVVCASYNTGTISVAITDPNKATTDTLPVVWIGVLNGLLEGSETEIMSRIDKNIDQMFLQSPYLKQ
ncbi:DUF4136 domain-containing protein [Flavihumibacter fluvii]|uniref:DUF4136 domain-containing protein n=1 Tax=Flavihumibacter fluvii TaxID=2838157 RepID=UPI001BDE505A|nr:DUF4136 domain-containing protein [Flavihumibacter fluvii]ULQ54081.1 DUF4136 domain-containing protein [Flavihumibacter fluvii]